MIYRLADETDFPRLARLRWDFHTERHAPRPGITLEIFLPACQEFLLKAQAAGNWSFWVAEQDGQIIANAFVQSILKVPYPGRLDPEFGYVTNVYTCPKYRDQGIGAELIRLIKEWGLEQRLEMLVLWPSRRSLTFYQRAGFLPSDEALELDLYDGL
jgi:GNAT superfamily N-acetyltransferase